MIDIKTTRTQLVRLIQTMEAHKQASALNVPLSPEDKDYVDFLEGLIEELMEMGLEKESTRTWSSPEPEPAPKLEKEQLELELEDREKPFS